MEYEKEGGELIKRKSSASKLSIFVLKVKNLVVFNDCNSSSTTTI